ncbi:MAG TPA: MoaD/ThiS family protein [Burkholderiales bacterium]|nr:MoaD/ThiS family protein [Burkholderiales bacterium]
MIRVFIPSPLFSYTGGQKQIEAAGESLAALLQTLDRRYPGMRHRIVDEQDCVRKHIRFFINGEIATRLDQTLTSGDEVMIVAALSGG